MVTCICSLAAIEIAETESTHRMSLRHDQARLVSIAVPVAVGLSMFNLHLTL